MQRYLAVFTLLLAAPIWANAMSFGVTTQMNQGGNIDKDRYFIFDFLVLGKNCAVTAITVNNASCSKNSIGEGRGFWLKVDVDVDPNSRTPDAYARRSPRCLEDQNPHTLLPFGSR